MNPLEQFEVAAREFIASRGSPRTRVAYLGDLKRWCDYCTSTGIDPTTPTLGAATAFRDQLIASCASLTVRRILAALSAVYRRLVAQEHKLVTWNPFDSAALDRPSAAVYQKTEIVTEVDAVAIMKAAESDTSVLGRRDTAILHLLRAAGLRRMSIATLRRHAVVASENGWVVRIILKGGAEAQSDVTPECARAIHAWLDVAPQSEWMFPSVRYKNAQPINVAVVNRVVTERSKAAGVPHVHPHQFRAAFITTALDSLPLHDVQAAVHHRDPRTTQRYDRGIRGKGVVTAVANARKPKEP